VWSYTFIPPYIFMVWCLGTGTNLPYVYLATLVKILVSRSHYALYRL